MSNKNKKVLKEEQYLDTPKPFNRYDNTDIEKTIIKILEKSFKDFTLESMRAVGETQYFNLNLSTEVEDIKEDLEFNRYKIGNLIRQFRQDFFTELSKYINVVNVNSGSYQFLKSSDTLKFGVTILLSNNNISDWVSGNKNKIESKKQFVEESTKKKKLKEATEEPDKLKTAEFRYPYKEFIIDVYYILTDEYNISMDTAESLLGKYKDYIRNFWYESGDVERLGKILAKRSGSLLVTEQKVSKVFNTGTKDEFDVKAKLVQKGLKAAIVKDKQVKVTWNSKKHNEEDIKKLIENNKKMKTSEKDVRIILESLYKESNTKTNIERILESLYNETLTEARPKSNTKEITKKKSNEKTEEIKPPVKITIAKETALQKDLIEFQKLTEEVDALTAKFYKSIESKNLKIEKLESKIFETMKKANMEVYSINNIIARITKEYTKDNVQYGQLVQNLLVKVNEETKKLILRLKKRYTRTSTVDSRLDVKRKGRKDESLNINEGIFDWIKSSFYSLLNYVSNLTNTRKQLERLEAKMKNN